MILYSLLQWLILEKIFTFYFSKKMTLLTKSQNIILVPYLTFVHFPAQHDQSFLTIKASPVFTSEETWIYLPSHSNKHESITSYLHHSCHSSNNLSTSESLQNYAAKRHQSDWRNLQANTPSWSLHSLPQIWPSKL